MGAGVSGGTAYPQWGFWEGGGFGGSGAKKFSHFRAIIY